MSKTVLFDVSNEFLDKLATSMRDEDSMLVLVPPVEILTHAPSRSGKNKNHFRLKVEFWIPKDAIKGEDALTDFGCSALLRLPNSRVSDHLITDKESAKDSGGTRDAIN